MDIYVSFGETVNDLIEHYGFDELTMASVFECECKCGEVYHLEPDGKCVCYECGAVVESPLLAEGFI